VESSLYREILSLDNTVASAEGQLRSKRPRGSAVWIARLCLDANIWLCDMQPVAGTKVRILEVQHEQLGAAGRGHGVEVGDARRDVQRRAKNLNGSSDV